MDSFEQYLLNPSLFHQPLIKLIAEIN